MSYLKIKLSTIIFVFFLILCSFIGGGSWGFFVHKKINRLAIFTLPDEMIGFYKKHITYITEKSINPDMRRYVNEAEAPRHYIDIDAYGENAFDSIPRNWQSAVKKYSEDTLHKYGIVPWHINKVIFLLTEAFTEKNVKKILKYSTDLGHYIADSNVPLHTTINYNGQFTGQNGIHSFWETRLPELFIEDYNFFVGQAEYHDYPLQTVWNGIIQAHQALDSVFRFEKELTQNFKESKKYGFQERGQNLTRDYSYEFSKAYHDKLNGMVERQMKASIKMLGDFWFTCWVNAGQPNLKDI